MILVTGAVGINVYGSSPQGDPHGHQEPPPQPSEDRMIGQSRDIDRSSVASSVSNKMTKSADLAPPPGVAQSAPVNTGVAGGPEQPKPELLRKAVDPQSYKPSPNESMTSAQWYSDEHGAYKNEKDKK